MVSIDAFQALDPGSIPGHRIVFTLRETRFTPEKDQSHNLWERGLKVWFSEPWLYFESLIIDHSLIAN